MYKQSFLVVFWILIVPLASVGTFNVSKKSGLFSIGDVEVPYAIRVLLIEAKPGYKTSPVTAKHASSDGDPGVLTPAPTLGSGGSI